MPIGATVRIVGAPERRIGGTPSVFVEIVYENERGFAAEGYLDKTDPRLIPTLQVLRGEHVRLYRAAARQHMGDVRSVLDSAPFLVNYPDDQGWTALMFASREGNLDVVRLLLQRGAAPNLRNDDEETSLLLAAKHGHARVVSELLALDDIGIDATDKSGRSAYAWAKDGSSTETAELLSEAGAAPSVSGTELPPFVAGGITAPILIDGPVLDAENPPQTIPPASSRRCGLSRNRHHPLALAYRSNRREARTVEMVPGVGRAVAPNRRAQGRYGRLREVCRETL